MPIFLRINKRKEKEKERKIIEGRDGREIKESNEKLKMTKRAAWKMQSGVDIYAV